MRARRALVLGILALALGALLAVLSRLADPARFPPDDFVIFWASGRVLAAGGNPYDDAALLAVERTADWTGATAYRMWNPPWILPVLLPFGVLPYQAGRIAWFLLHLVLIVAASDLWWRLSGGSARRRGVAWLLPFALVPTMIAWRTGQVTPFVLVGLVLFAAAERRGRDVAAGAALACATTKPHLVYLFWPALVLWVVARRRWRVAVGFVGALGVLIGLALAVRPAILADFAASLGTHQPRNPTSTIGTVLRLGYRELCGEDRFALVTVAPVVGLAWLAWRWHRRRAAWRWIDELPPLTLVSLALAPFAWVYDELLAILPLVQLAALAEHTGQSLPLAALGGLVAFDVAVLAMNLARIDPFWYVWTPFALLGLYASARRQLAER
jgi:hypothetical protein